MRLTSILFCLFCIVINLNVNAQGIVINEVMSANLSSIPDVYVPDYSNCPVPDCESWYDQLGDLTMDGDYPDWIELYNPGNISVNLQGFGLSDDLNEPFKWTFPNIEIAAQGYLVVFATGLDVKETSLHHHLHTNFKISTNKESITLYQSSGELLTKVNTQNIPIDMSVGRNPAKENEWLFFTHPTPGAKNESPVFNGYTNNISMSEQAGFFNSAFELSLQAVLSNEKIYYTLDGSNPTTNSAIYKNPILINKTTVIKAQTFKDGIISSPVVTQTYFVGENASLPVVSLISPPEHLWDDDFGIYTAGSNAFEPNRIANYWKDWERPCTIQYFDNEGNKAFSIELGMKIFGWGSRSNDRKSISLYARNKYGYDFIYYPLFSQLAIDQFQSVVLRASGSDWQGTLFRDPMISSLVDKKDIDAQATEPVILFLNGEYWGIYNLREKLNEDYLAAHHNINKENVDIISQYWRRDYPVVNSGNDEEFNTLIDFIENNNIQTEANYNFVEGLIDIDNFVNYQVVEIYAANYDWPGNNSKCWKENTEGSKWRWLLYDLDYTFGSSGQNDYRHNTLEHATDSRGSSWPNPSNTTFLLRELLKNETFSQLFINRFADLLNTVFLPDVVEGRIADFEENYLPEIDKHIKRWGINNNKNASRTAWQNNIDDLIEFAEKRPASMRNHIQDYFGLSGKANLKLKMNLVDAGSIKINSIRVDDKNWEGIYFKDVPVQLTAIPAPGYRFVSWEGIGNSDKSNPVVSVNLNTNNEITANFEVDNNALNTIVISEIFFNPNANNEADWVELKNTYNVPMDLSGWLLKDKTFSHRFKIPQGSVIDPYNYLVICRDQNSFHSLFPGISNYTGDLNFGLDADADLVLLLDQDQQVVDSVYYTDKTPWPSAMSGNSISLMSPELDNSQGQHWYSGNNDLSPGRANGIWTDAQLISRTATELRTFPNPFSEAIAFQFSLTSNELVILKIYTSEGREMLTLCNQVLNEGQHQYVWDTSYGSQYIKPGLYLYSVQTGDKYLSGKIMKMD